MEVAGLEVTMERWRPASAAAAIIYQILQTNTRFHVAGLDEALVGHS